MEPVVVLLHPDLGEHFADILLIGLGATLAWLFPLIFFPQYTSFHRRIRLDDGYDGYDT